MTKIEEEKSERRRVVMVGVKLDPPSRELLTWTLVKVAQPGDQVIALHVLDSINENVDVERKPSLQLMVKAYDCVLDVYSSFCNLKQVNLKLKICRGGGKGESIRKILVHEAKSLKATHLIVGSSTSLAKYCATKLGNNCSILAVNNSKILFARETKECYHWRSGLLSTIQRSLIKKCKLSTCGTLDLPLVTKASQTTCCICPKVNAKSTQESLQNENDYKSCSFRLSIREFPEGKPGWPLLHRAIQMSRPLTSQISVVDWAIRLPNRQTLYIQNSVEKDLPQELEGLHKKCRQFKYEELFLATSSFIPENLVGKGGNSQVYRGQLPDGREVAVKILNPSEDAVKQFVSEIEIITTLHHKNILSLFGFCYDTNQLLLVYPFLSRGSLEENLHGSKKDPYLFGWSERYKVALGVAEALNYLHTRKQAQPVIHRDVKSSNILLSIDFNPQLSDFGLAKWASTTSSHITCTDVVGTFGYLAPEYFMYGKVNEKIDVYAFGVVLLELLSGRKPINNEYPKGEEFLVMWAKPILSNGMFIQLLDPSLESNYDYEQIERMVLAAALCTRRTPRGRPKMSVVLKLLKGDTETMKKARLQVNASKGSQRQTQTNLHFASSEASDIAVDEDEFSHSDDRQCHLNLALQDMEEEEEEEEEDFISISSAEQSVDMSLEDYLRGRCSHSSTFD